MDGMSGPQALREIRRDFPTAFVIMLTASGDLETVRDGTASATARRATS